MTSLRQQIAALLHGHSSQARIEALAPELRTAIMSADDPLVARKLALDAYDSDSRGVSASDIDSTAGADPNFNWGGDP